MLFTIEMKAEFSTPPVLLYNQYIIIVFLKTGVSDINVRGIVCVWYLASIIMYLFCNNSAESPYYQMLYFKGGELKIEHCSYSF